MKWLHPPIISCMHYKTYIIVCSIHMKNNKSSTIIYHMTLYQRESKIGQSEVFPSELGKIKTF